MGKKASDKVIIVVISEDSFCHTCISMGDLGMQVSVY